MKVITLESINITFINCFTENQTEHIRLHEMRFTVNRLAQN